MDQMGANAAVMEPYFSYTAPNFTIGPTTANSISTLTKTLNYKIKGFIYATGATAFANLTVNIKHECYDATLTAPATMQFSYTVLDP